MAKLRSRAKHDVDALDAFSLSLWLIMGDEELLLHEVSFTKDEDKGQALFVVGSPRSGTSILGSTLSDALGYKHFGECHVMALFGNLKRLISVILGFGGSDSGDDARAAKPSPIPAKTRTTV
ncbi:MAG: hypothetical protein R2880_07655 [Deinococcales bacterium]